MKGCEMENRRGQVDHKKTVEFNDFGLLKKAGIDDLLWIIPERKRGKIKRIISYFGIKELRDFLKYRPVDLMIKGIGPGIYLELKLALMSFGYYFDNDSDETVKRKLKNTETISESGLYKLRFEILQRDNFKCKYCGRTPKIDNEIILHIDHVYPLSKGGSWKKSNLVAACLECNIGKSDVILDAIKARRSK